MVSGEDRSQFMTLTIGWLTVVCLLAMASVWVGYRLASTFPRHRSMPPGPPGIPIFGNALQMPYEKMFLQFSSWAETYGPIFSLNLAGKPTIVLNSLMVAEDLLDRRSAIYSDRPRLIVTGELMTGGMSVGFMPYGHVWRRQRRAIHEAFNSREAQSYQTLQEKGAAHLVLRLLNDPDHWQEQFEKSAAATVVSIIYGTSLAERHLDSIVKEVDHLIRSAARASGKAAHLVEIFPALLHLPSWLVKWKRDGQAMFRKYTELFAKYLDEVQAQDSIPTVPDADTSFAAQILRNADVNGISRKECAWLAGILIGAGLDTTAGMLSVFMLAAALYPNVMARAQVELDSVVSENRLPTFEDQAQLPYVTAIVKELLRWMPVAPLGIPRRCTQDNWYDGYLIPEGAMVIENIWAMAHDPELFPEPEEFRPERFLGQNYKSAYLEQKHLAFGFGRRLCPGMSVASQTLFIDIACVIWALDIRPKSSVDGESTFIPSKDSFVDDGLVVRPVEFPCDIRLRFPAAEGLLRSKISQSHSI